MHHCYTLAKSPGRFNGALFKWQRYCIKLQRHLFVYPRNLQLRFTKV